MKLHQEFFTEEILVFCNVGQEFYIFQRNGYAKFRLENKGDGLKNVCTCLYSNISRYKRGKGHQLSANFTVSLYLPPFSTTIRKIREIIGTKDNDLEFQYNGKTVPFCEAILTSSENPRFWWVSCALGRYLDKKYFPEREKWYVPTVQLFLDMMSDFKDNKKAGFEVFQSSGTSTWATIDTVEKTDNKTIIYLS